MSPTERQTLLPSHRRHVEVRDMASRRERENAAANAVVYQLSTISGAALIGCIYDDGSRDRMHDFTITGEGHAIALEVTTIADGARVGREHRWNRAAPEGWAIIPGLTGCWIAHHEGVTEADEAVAALRAGLPALEALGIDDVTTARWQDHLLAAPATRPPEWDHLRALNAAGFTILSRVTDASVELLAEHGGQASISRGFGFNRPADRNFPITVITDELGGAHSSDVRKLREAQHVTARHLWMWVEITEGLAMLRSFESEGLPDEDIDIDGIDGIWLGTSPTDNVVAGYVWISGRGWCKFSAPRDETDLPAC